MLFLIKETFIAVQFVMFCMQMGHKNVRLRFFSANSICAFTNSIQCLVLNLKKLKEKVTF